MPRTPLFERKGRLLTGSLADWCESNKERRLNQPAAPALQCIALIKTPSMAASARSPSSPISRSNGDKFDPAVVFDDGDSIYLAAGHHRRAAYEKARCVEMPCIVKQGSKIEAIEYGVQDNLQHRGERLTNADKRHR